MNTPAQKFITTLTLLLLSLALAPAGFLRAEPLEAPDLVPLPPDDIAVAESERDPSVPSIRFATSTANRGAWPLDLLSTGRKDRDGGIVKQCVAWSDPRTCAKRVRAGRFIFHPEHGHFHFDEFAVYELRRLVDGKVDMSRSGLVAGGKKVSFCLIDDELDSVPNDPTYLIPNLSYRSCDSRTGQQGISPGWKDTYEASVQGQEIALQGVPDGTYAIVLVVDPDELLFDSDRTNNFAATGIKLSENLTSVEVICTAEAGSKSCEPN